MRPPAKIIRKAIKHLYLRIDVSGQLIVSVPKKMSDAEIFAFIDKKREWIANRQRQLHARQQQDKGALVLFGQHYSLHRQQAQRNHLTFHQQQAYLTLKPHVDEKKWLIEYYRAQLMPVVHQWIAYYRPIIGVSPAEVRSKNMKTKWGTCNTQAKRLWFNVQLARFSSKHIEYVVVHEMVHLLEPSHNRRFYALVERAMPDWKQYHVALKRST